MFMLPYKPFKNAYEQNIYIEKAKEGDKKARERIYCSVFPAVKSWVTKYFNFTRARLKSVNDFDDFMSEAFMGVDKAINNFDMTRGVKFITFSSWYVRSALDGYYHDKTRLIRIPRNVSRLVNAKEEKLKEVTDFTMESREIAKFTMTAQCGYDMYFGTEEPEQERNAGYQMMCKKITEWAERELEVEKHRKALYMMLGINGYDEVPANYISDMLRISKNLLWRLKKDALEHFRVVFAE